MKKILRICVAAALLLLPLGAQENTSQIENGTAVEQRDERVRDEETAVFANGRYRMEIIAIDLPIELVIDGATWTYTIENETTVDQIEINYSADELIFPSMQNFAAVFSFKKNGNVIDLFFAESTIFNMLDFSIIFGSEGSENSVTAAARDIFQEKMNTTLRSMPVIRLIKLDDEAEQTEQTEQ